MTWKLDKQLRMKINPLKPNDHYSGRTAWLTYKVAFYIFIQQILGTEYFKRAIYFRVFLFKIQFFS